MLANLFFRLFSELVAVEMHLSSPSYSNCSNTHICNTGIIFLANLKLIIKALVVFAVVLLNMTA